MSNLLKHHYKTVINATIIPQTISIIVIITKNLIILRIISNLSRTALRNDLFCDSSESKPGQYLQISEYSSSVSG